MYPVVLLFPYVMLVVVRALDVIYHPTLCHFVCFVFRVHQQGYQGVDRFVVHWYVVGLEHPCLLFRQLTNVRQTYDMLSSVGFSGVDVLLISYWLVGVENP